MPASICLYGERFYKYLDSKNCFAVSQAHNILT